MDKQMLKQQRQLEKREDKLVSQKSRKKNQIDYWLENCEQKIPSVLKNTLEMAFFKGFQLVFEKGSGLIEKTYPKEQRKLEHEVNEFTIHNRLIKQGLRKMDGQVWKSHAFNSCTAFAEGAGLGILGIGLPDIPLFIAMILKGIYETAVSYGFSYDSEEERVWILRIIGTALSEGDKKLEYHNEVTELREALIEKKSLPFDFQKELKNTSEVLSEAMLLMKFVQGLPVVGVVGSVGNFSIYQKVAKYCNIQYKMRYLQSMHSIK